MVLVNNRMAGFDLPCVVSDERGGVRQAVEHLMERGHRRIGMLAGRLAPYITSQRYGAFVEVMADHGLPVRDEDIKMCDLNIHDAIRAAVELLDRPDRPTALFAANDIIAAATVKAAAPAAFAGAGGPGGGGLRRFHRLRPDGAGAHQCPYRLPPDGPALCGAAPGGAQRGGKRPPADSGAHPSGGAPVQLNIQNFT